LFIFEGIVKQQDEQILTGVLFSASRAQMEKIEPSLAQTTTHPAAREQKTARTEQIIENNEESPTLHVKEAAEERSQPSANRGEQG
jgi:hypothetical protein